MPPTTLTTFQADEHLAAHLLSLAFVETTPTEYWGQLGTRSFRHPGRGLHCWLDKAERKIILVAGAHWRFEAHGHVLAETLNFLLTTVVSPAAAPTDSRPCPLPELGYRHSPTTPTTGQLPPLAGG